MRRRRLFWQLFPATLLIALVALAVIALDASASLRQFYLDRTAEDLQSRARLVEDQIAPLLAAGKRAEIDALCKDLGKRSATRFTVILPKGKVLGDSERAPQEMDNHATRQEVSEALDKGVGVSLRTSDTLKQELRYVAVAVRQDGKTLGVIRAAISLAAIDSALSGIRLHILIASALIAVVIAAASLLIARRTVKPLEELRQHAEWFAHGDLSHRLPAGGPEEIGGLAETLNTMAAELNEKLAEVVRQRNERDAILSSMVEGVLAIDAEEHVLSMNAAAARLLGANSARAAGRSLPEVIRSIDLHKLVAAVIATRQPVEGEIVLRNPDTRCLRVQGTLLGDRPNRPGGALLVFHDITDLKRLESIRRDFVANVSHELKTPVTAIQGYVETLLDGAMNHSEEREKFLRIVAKHTERLHAILEDLLTLARVEQEGEKRENLLTTGPLRPVLDAAMLDCRAKADEKRMRLTIDCPDDVELPMNASLLEQAVVNLLENAIAYSLQEGAIEIDCVQDAQEVAIRVRDYGCGISREHLPRIFERFYRVDKSRSRDSGGTGLGLAIVKHIIQLHGGRATVESTPGKGSIFSLLLPNRKS